MFGEEKVYSLRSTAGSTGLSGEPKRPVKTLWLPNGRPWLLFWEWFFVGEVSDERFGIILVYS